MKISAKNSGIFEFPLFLIARIAAPFPNGLRETRFFYDDFFVAKQIRESVEARVRFNRFAFD